ncbi:hypothetical protein K439DRAFT_1661056 [Ramaria rubella]|nr:hypothetical protein K439DRAFT_1661056 [Ramaria rubella]
MSVRHPARTSHIPCTSDSPSRTFDALPHELLLHHLAYFHDLSSHLAFSTTCRRIHALYDENLWRRISISAGLGKPLDLSPSKMSWRRICMTAVVHARACRLPDCSEISLSRGEILSAQASAIYLRSIGRDRGLFEPHRDLLCSRPRVFAEQIDIRLSSIFEGLTGDLEDLYSVTIPCIPGSRPWASWVRRLFRISEPEDDILASIALPAPYKGGGMVTRLAHHFSASCALATVPAVNMLELDIGRETLCIRNLDGVCVWDVITALARK